MLKRLKATQRRALAKQRKRRRRLKTLRANIARARVNIIRRRKRIRRATVDAPTKALRWANEHVGKTEDPPGSNRGPGITSWQRSFGAWLIGQAWCGVFVGKALQAAGVKGISWRIASVAYIEDDARAGRNGFKSWHGRENGQRGDAVVVGGRGVHVELIRHKVEGGYETVGGNTSPDASGSQSNGGGVWHRFRSFSSVHGCARPNY